MQNSMQKVKNIGNSIIQSRKNVDDFWLKFWDWRTVQRSTLCRSRRELSNEYLLAKIGVDKAENEPLEVWGKIIQYYSFVSLIVWRVGPNSSALRPPQRHVRTLWMGNTTLKLARMSVEVEKTNNPQAIFVFEKII